MHTAGATQSSSGEQRAASQGLQELCEEASRIRADRKCRRGVLETRADVDGSGGELRIDLRLPVQCFRRRWLDVAGAASPLHSDIFATSSDVTREVIYNQSCLGRFVKQPGRRWKQPWGRSQLIHVHFTCWMLFFFMQKMYVYIFLRTTDWTKLFSH